MLHGEDEELSSTPAETDRYQQGHLQKDSPVKDREVEKQTATAADSTV